jgi:hypothetical protein
MPSWVIHSKEASLIIANVYLPEIKETGSLRSILLEPLRILKEEIEAPLLEEGN